MLNELHYIHLLAHWPFFLQGMMWLCETLKPPYILFILFFFSVAYLILLLFSCINTLICIDLFTRDITSQVAGAHNAWFPYS